jgi:hypothetical protein
LQGLHRSLARARKNKIKNKIKKIAANSKKMARHSPS